MAKSRIVFLDIENSPSLGWAWGKYDQNIIDFKTDWYLLSFAWKWADETIVRVKGLIDYKNYIKNVEDDRQLTQALWDVLDQADIVIGHNVDRFDIRKINTRFLAHGMPPPSPYKTVDTLKIARKYFKFDSNHLTDLGRCLGVGKKLTHTGFELWRGCMVGDKSCWRMMKRYNARDVILLEKVYYLLRAWAGNHPDVTNGEVGCPKCGSPRTQKRGISRTKKLVKQRYQCTKCGGWFEETIKKAFLAKAEGN